MIASSKLGEQFNILFSRLCIQKSSIEYPEQAVTLMTAMIMPHRREKTRDDMRKHFERMAAGRIGLMPLKRLYVVGGQEYGEAYIVGRTSLGVCVLKYDGDTGLMDFIVPPAIMDLLMILKEDDDHNLPAEAVFSFFESIETTRDDDISETLVRSVRNQFNKMIAEYGG